jgi:hypothetical protein
MRISTAVLFLLAATMAQAQSPRPKAPTQSPATSAAPTYVPPLRGAPSRRVGGSTRSIGQILPVVSVLAPDHVGLTTVAQPVLYWFISKPTRVRLEITLIDESGVKPMLELPIDRVEGPAIHAVDLKKYGIQLKRGMEYQWTVALVPDAAERSGDIISGGVIKLVELPSALGGGAGVTSPAELAGAGLWYDAIHALSIEIAAQPNNVELRAQRAGLLEQAGLVEAAAFDRTN